MDEQLSEAQFDQLTEELENAIDDMESRVGSVRVSRRGELKQTLPEKQAEKLEQAVRDSVDKFLPRFRRAARKETCEKGGFIHDQWEKYGDIAKKDLIKVSAGILTGMGIVGSSLLLAVVPVALWIFTALTNIGIRALCDDDASR